MKKIQAKTFTKFFFLGNLQSSPNGKHYAFLASKAKDSLQGYDHVLHIGTRTSTKTFMRLNSANYCFLDEETLLLNTHTTKQEAQENRKGFLSVFYASTLSDKKLTKSFSVPFRARIEGRRNVSEVLLSASMAPEDHVLYEGDKKEREDYVSATMERSFFEDFDERPYYQNGGGFTHGKMRQLFSYNLKEGTLKRLLPKDFSFEAFAFSQDKKTLYYTGKTKEEMNTMTSGLYAYDFEHGTHRVLCEHGTLAFMFLEEIDRVLVAAAKSTDAYGLNQNPDFYRFKDGDFSLLKTYGESVGNTLSTDCKLMPSPVKTSKDGKLYFLSTIDDHVEIRSLNLKGELDTVCRYDGGVDGMVSQENGIFVVAMHAQKLQEVYAYDLTAKPRQVTQFNAKLSEHNVVKPRPLVIKRQGYEVKGFVLLPKEYDGFQKFPAVLNIHGGPKTSYGSIYHHEMQHWVNEGYVVFFANPKGSDGKGDDFADLRGCYGKDDYEDLMAFAEAVLNEYPAIDRGKLFVAGQSYGGFMVNWIIAHTNMFKAAISDSSITNWISYFGTSDIGHFFTEDQTALKPTNMEALLRQSPLYYAEDIETPLLLIHGEKDYRCPIEQAQQFYALLKWRGVDVRFLWMKNEGHGFSFLGSPQARMKRLNVIEEWLERFR